MVCHVSRCPRALRRPRYDAASTMSPAVLPSADAFIRATNRSGREEMEQKNQREMGEGGEWDHGGRMAMVAVCMPWTRRR